MKHTHLKVSDHAVLRYLERVHGVDIAGLRHRIARNADMAYEVGAKSVQKNGVRYCLRDYEAVTDELNFKLEEAGLEPRIGKTSVHAFGQDFQRYAQMQEQAQDEMRAFLEEASLKAEVDATSALFQQLTYLQWKLHMGLSGDAGGIDPRGMKDLTQALNNLIRSTSLRDNILSAEREAQAAKLDQAVSAGDMKAEAAAQARQILGFG